MDYAEIFKQILIEIGLLLLLIYTLIVIYTVIVVKLVGFVSNMVFHPDKVSGISVVFMGAGCIGLLVLLISIT